MSKPKSCIFCNGTGIEQPVPDTATYAMMDEHAKNTEKLFKQMKEQIEKLKDYIIYNIEGEPSREESVADCVIRILQEYKQQVEEGK